jgi:hypothetical protein
MEGGIFVIEALELLRRWMWVVFRVEAEWSMSLRPRRMIQEADEWQYGIIPARRRTTSSWATTGCMIEMAGRALGILVRQGRQHIILAGVPRTYESAVKIYRLRPTRRAIKSYFTERHQARYNYAVLPAHIPSPPNLDATKRNEFPSARETCKPGKISDSHRMSFISCPQSH